MRRLVLDNRSIDALAANAAMVADFPFLAKVTTSRGCCGKVGRTPDYPHIKEAVASLSEDRLRIFKERVGAETIVLFLRNGREVTV